MRTWRLTRQAEHRLIDIARWTIEHFGHDQAIRYRDQIIQRMTDLASGDFPIGRDCSVLAPIIETGSTLRFSQVGRHYVIYRDLSDELQIIDFVHVAQDLESIVAELTSNPKQP